MSQFSEALQRLLDETNLFTRAEWCEVCGVELAVLDSWLRDESIPPAYFLNMLLFALQDSTDVVKGPVEDFVSMASRPARKVSPLGTQMLPTVAEYMKRPIFSELSNRLAKLSPEERGRALDKFYPAV
jgi:hypothetical protein